MPIYEYTGLNEAGRQVKGLRDADSARSLRSSLKREGVFITSVAEGESRSAGDVLSQDVDLSKIRGRVGTEDIAIMTRQLATLVGSGVALIEALSALQDQVDHPTLKRVVGRVKQRVNEGASLADALEEHAKFFSHIYINMVRAGESSGAMDVVLVRLADFTEGQARLKQKVSSALMYPAIMVIIGIAILAILMTVVVPKVTQMFQDIGATLPWTTRLLIKSAEISQSYWWLILGLVVLFVIVFRWWKKTETGEAIWDRFLLNAPIFGPIVRMLAMARFSRTLGTLLRSGVPIVSALQIVRNVLNNVILAKVIDEAKAAIQEGESIAAPLRRSGQFPPLVYHMVAIGERSGQLEEMLQNAAESYETQVESRISGLTSLLEPVLIVLMGGMVAFVVFSILMPILRLNTMIQA